MERLDSQNVCQTDDVVGHIPIAQEYRAPGVATYNVPAISRDDEVNDFIVGVRPQYAVPAVPGDALTAKPIVIRKDVDKERRVVLSSKDDAALSVLALTCAPSANTTRTRAGTRTVS
eukprot:COSAG02_NODE_26366_length_634_cov_2.071028_1_plen_117_part_00